MKTNTLLKLCYTPRTLAVIIACTVTHQEEYNVLISIL